MDSCYLTGTNFRRKNLNRLIKSRLLRQITAGEEVELNRTAQRDLCARASELSQETINMILQTKNKSLLFAISPVLTKEQVVDSLLFADGKHDLRGAEMRLVDITQINPALLFDVLKSLVEQHPERIPTLSLRVIPDVVTQIGREYTCSSFDILKDFPECVPALLIFEGLSDPQLEYLKKQLIEHPITQDISNIQKIVHLLKEADYDILLTKMPQLGKAIVKCTTLPIEIFIKILNSGIMIDSPWKVIDILFNKLKTQEIQLVKNDNYSKIFKEDK